MITHLGRLDRLARWWAEHDGVIYAVFATSCTVYAASLFYGYMLVQTGGVWSAPLDDVFIHFDYARSTARGFPFQWSEGNGYSSGNTSLSYPLVLGIGYWLGFRSLALVIWSGFVAIVSLLGFLLAAGRLVQVDQDRGRVEVGWARYLIPPAVLSMGALDWTLFSGMENAFHLGIWGACLAATLWQGRALDRRQATRRAWAIGVCGALLVSTRPESGICVAAFGIYAALRGHRRRVTPGFRGIAEILLASGAPGIVLLVVQGIANVIFTGEWSANGAIAKLILNNPYMSASDMWDKYQSLLGYILPRLLFHHFSDHRWFGLLLPALGLVPLVSARTRGVALLLWSQIVGWMLLVALNHQLRWHNERYSMPSVAWLMVLAALGLGVIAAHLHSEGSGRLLRSWSRGRPLRVAAALALVAAYWSGQSGRFRDQVWFFGRACRNILDQHVSAGLLLKQLKVKRVLVGDAGALTYASDRPGLDLIGLGGFHAYPFARATVHGLGASLELIERIPVADRPDYMAIYPHWWEDLPTYFGDYLTSVPVRGNVICGGAAKVLYRADWRALDRRGSPRNLVAGERIIDELDVADLISERNHGYATLPTTGYIRQRVLADPADPQADLFDAGRIVPGGHAERATLLSPPGGGRLVVRVAPEKTMRVEVAVDGKRVGELVGEPKIGTWQELDLPLPTMVDSHFELTLTVLEGTSVHYHAWVLAR